MDAGFRRHDVTQAFLDANRQVLIRKRLFCAISASSCGIVETKRCFVPETAHRFYGGVS
jgi:hypothetical protein